MDSTHVERDHGPAPPAIGQGDGRTHPRGSGPLGQKPPSPIDPFCLHFDPVTGPLPNLLGQGQPVIGPSVTPPEHSLGIFTELGDSLSGNASPQGNVLADRYYVLAAYLRERRHQNRVVLSLTDIERILGGPLPHSAATVDLFWSNQASYAVAWLSAGFRSNRRGLPRNLVAFMNQAVAIPDQPDNDLLTAAELALLATGAWAQAPLTAIVLADGQSPPERKTGELVDLRDRDSRDENAVRRDPLPRGAGRGLAYRLTKEFCEKRMDLGRHRASATGPLGTDVFGSSNIRPARGRSNRAPAAGASPPMAGWEALPEVVVANLLRGAGATEVEVRLFLTFGASMNRGQDPDRLWLSALELFRLAPWAYDPFRAATADTRLLAASLAGARLSLSPTDDAVAWRTIAASLAERAIAPPIHDAIFGPIHDANFTPIHDPIVAPLGPSRSDGFGDRDGDDVHDGNAPERPAGLDALELLAALDALDSQTGARRFPALCAPRTGPRWVRMLVHPGGVHLSSLDRLPLAVDASVRRATECLGVTATRGRPMGEVRAHIQETWQEDVLRHGTVAPAGLEGTNAALEPALTFLGRWGCAACERSGRRMPISDACAECRLGGPARQV